MNDLRPETLYEFRSKRPQTYAQLTALIGTLNSLPFSDEETAQMFAKVGSELTRAAEARGEAAANEPKPPQAGVTSDEGQTMPVGAQAPPQGAMQGGMPMRGGMMR